MDVTIPAYFAAIIGMGGFFLGAGFAAVVIK